MSFSETGSSNGLGKQPESSLFSPSLQVDSGITTKDDGDRGIRDSEVDTAKTSDYEENQLIRRKLGLSKKQSHTLQEIFKIHNPFTPSTVRKKLTESQRGSENKTSNQENLKTFKKQMDLYGYVHNYLLLTYMFIFLFNFFLIKCI